MFGSTHPDPAMRPLPARRSRTAILIVVAAALAAAGGVAGMLPSPLHSAARREHSSTQSDSVRSSDWLSILPDGAEKQRFILDCTGCHQMTDQHVRPGGSFRTVTQWSEIVERMLRYGGATTPFPVMSAHRDASSTAEWLARNLTVAPEPAALPSNPPGSATASVREYLMPIPQDLPHDVAILEDGRIAITGMMSGRMYTLDPATGAFGEVTIPLQRANPRAIEVDRQGRWWIALGAPKQVARHTPGTGAWDFFRVDVYPHSIALAPDGSAWVNGHFTRAPELLVKVDAAGVVTPVELPRHPTLAAGPGGPIPYEIRIANDGTVWMGELLGDRIIAHVPSTGASRVYELPRHSGPRRFDIDSRGDLWIPAYGTNRLLHLEAGTGRVTEHPLPIRDAVPYVVKLDERTGAVWIGTSAADAILRFDTRTTQFASYRLPSRGALIRHMAVEPRTGSLWIAYGASPGIAARVARLTLHPPQ